MNGWHRFVYKGDELDTVVLVSDGLYSGAPVKNWQDAGYTFEPVVVLTVEEHAALVRDAEMARRLREVSAGIVREG